MVLVAALGWILKLLNLNFEIESARKLVIISNMDFQKAMNLNVDFLKPMNLNFAKSMNLTLNSVFSKSMNLN